MGVSDEIRDAVREAQEGRLFINPIGDFVFKPIFKAGFVIRHPYESKDVHERYKDYLAKHNIPDTTDFPRRFKTNAGVRVRSKAELIVANALTGLGIFFYYEPILDFGNFFRKPDFYLPKLDLIYEHFGRVDYDYTQSRLKKEQLYSNYNMSWIYTESKDEDNIMDAIREKIRSKRF